jgi:hypothetical protein
MIQFSQAAENAVSQDKILSGLDDLRQACNSEISNLKCQYGWPDSDLRITSIHRLRNVFQSVLALRIFHQVIFKAEAFWRTFFVAVPNPAEFTDHFRECEMLIRFAAVHGPFSALESDIRGFVHALDPTAGGGATAQFDGIARWLLARATTAAPFQDFVELIRLTRNTIHNNGVHRPVNGRDATVKYAGKTYEFRVGQPVDFVDWSFVLFVGHEILRLLKTLSTDASISNLSSVSVP